MNRRIVHPAPVPSPDAVLDLVPVDTARTAEHPLGRHQPYKPVARLGGWVQGLLVGLIVVDVAAVLVVRDAIEDLFPTAALDVVEVAILISFLACAIGGAVWLHRVTSNLSALGAWEVPYDKRSAIWWWLVPIANLVKPPLIMHTVAKASHPDYAPRSAGWKAAPALAIIPVWWVAWLTARVMCRVVVASDDIDAFWFTGAGMGLLLVIDLVAMGLGIVVVRSITERQRHRATRLARAGLLPAELADHRCT